MRIIRQDSSQNGKPVRFDSHCQFLGIKPDNDLCSFLDFNGRGGVIRTLDPLLPKQMRYQAALRPDDGKLGVRLLLGKQKCAFCSSSKHAYGHFLLSKGH